MEDLDRSLNCVELNKRFSRRPNSINKQLKLREITRKFINEIEKLETEIKVIKELKAEAIELKSSKLLSDLNVEKGIEIEEI